MTAVRSLRPAISPRPLNRLRDPRERMEMIEQISMRERISEEEAAQIADRLTMFERTILDLEAREKSRAGYTSDYDVATELYRSI